jgi:hypothetical protein
MVLAGTLLHFTFEWSGRCWVVGIFSAVNESVWEHLKLGFWPFLLFSLIEYGFLKGRVGNFAVGKAAGILAFELFVVVGFYGYTRLIGRHLLALDIGLFVLGCGIGYAVSYRIITVPKLGVEWQAACVAFLIVHTVLEIVFTFRPPRLPIFRDSRTGRYGAYYEDSER